MKSLTTTVIQGLMFTAPIVLSSTIAVAPSRAASLAGAAGSLVLENFTEQGSAVFTATDALTETIAVAPGSIASSGALAEALATPERSEQFSLADVSGSGLNYFAGAQGTSVTSVSGIGFDAQCGCFRFDFRAGLAVIAQATGPGAKARANSFVAFYIFSSLDLTSPIDFFEASLSESQPLNLVRSSDFINIATLDEQPGGATIDGFYERAFDQGTQLTVRGLTRAEAVATVPEPPMFAALMILPGLIWLKRRSKLKPLPQEVTSRRFG